MLSRLDDYPVHQTSEPLAVPAQNDRNAYDRYWFNGYADDGEFYFGVAMGRYPNLGIIDGAFSIVRDGQQHCFFASRRAPREPTDTSIGPFDLRVVEPMVVNRLVVDDNETGISCDLTFTARTAAVEEGRQTKRDSNGRIMIDNTRFAQYGRWSGEVNYGGETLRVDGARTLGTKDRSWGLRPVGAADPGPAPLQQLPQFWFLWNPVHWSDRCTHVGIFQEADGYQWHTDAVVVPAYDDPSDIPGVEDPGARYLRSATHHIDWQPGTRWARHAEVTISDPDGTHMEIDLDPVLRFHMKGIGYRHPEWNHGSWKGELAIGSDVFKSDELDPMAVENIHVQQVSMATSGTETGVGVMEHMCIGPHAPSGFTDLLDPAP